MKLAKPLECVRVACLQPLASTQRCCHPLTAIPLSAVHPHCIFSLKCIHAWSPTRQLARVRIADILHRQTVLHWYLLFPTFTPLTQSALIKCFSAGFIIWAELLYSQMFISLASPCNCFNVQMLNIAQVPQLVSASTDRAFWFFLFFFQMVHCPFLATVCAALFVLLSSCYLSLFIVSRPLLSPQVFFCFSYLNIFFYLLLTFFTFCSA